MFDCPYPKTYLLGAALTLGVIAASPATSQAASASITNYSNGTIYVAVAYRT
jgi:hypothetical protein